MKRETEKKVFKNSILRRSTEAGNVFFTLFGAVAIVGAIGATATGVMRGPMKSMTEVSSRAMTESNVMANTRLAVMAVSKMPVQDCDLDGMVEPLPFRTPAGGEQVPAGGGLMPLEIPVTMSTDAWGNEYGYCVWDHGTLVDDAGCGGAGQNRLPGLNTTTYPAGQPSAHATIAILSAGRDRVFQTTCQDWATADANSDGDLDYASGDTPLVNKPDTSDDLIMWYTYGEAALATSSNWRMQTNPSPDTAEITEDTVEVSGPTSVGGQVDTGGLILAQDPGDDSISGPCNAVNDQALRVNNGSSPSTMEICDYSGSGWTSISGSGTAPAACTVESGDISEISSYTGANLDQAMGVTVSGNYAYVASYNIDSLTVIDISNPGSPIELDSISSANLDGATDVAVSGNYAYVVSWVSDSITSIDISDPSNLSEVDSHTSANLDGAEGIIISGSYAYVVSDSANSITSINISNPANLTEEDSFTSGNLAGARDVSLSGDYAYVASFSADSLTTIDISDPANLSEADSYTSANLDGAIDVVISGDYAYVASFSADSLTTIDISDPANLSEADSYASANLDGASDVAISGNYAFVAARTADAAVAIDISDPANLSEADSYTTPP